MKKTIRLTALSLVLIMMVAVLASCAPSSDPDKALEALKDNGYTAVKDSTVTPGLMKIAGIDDVDCVVSGTKGSETVTIIYFESSSACSDSWEEAQKYLDDDKDNKDDDSDYVIKKSGKMIYAGTKEAVKAAR